ncbi:hypothetical protein HK097_006734, partial [Rhizophlyctis rosea]
SKYPKIGQIFLLTYSAVLLNTTGIDPVTGKTLTVVDMAVRRGFAVAVGVFIGLLVSWYIWPFTARKALRINLAYILFDIGILYQKMVDLFDQDVIFPEEKEEFLEKELGLRLLLAKQRELLSQTVHEPRLVGEFPTAVYGRMIDGCGEILDRLVGMRGGITQAHFPSLRQDFIIPINPYRTPLIRAISLTFYILSGSLMLKAPLPRHLPDARTARSRSVDQIRRLPACDPRSVVERGDPMSVYYYAYVVGMEDVVTGLEVLGGLGKALFG